MLTPFIHSFIHPFIPWIRKFVMATVDCEINHKDAKHTGKYSNKTKTKKQYNEITDKYFYKIL